MRKIEVVPYNKDWPFLFQKEACLIKKIFGHEIVEIYHIGSTSVVGLKAKPIIDILPVVKDIDKVDDFNGKMIKIGYEPTGENGIAGRRFFHKGGDNRTHHVHIFEKGDANIKRHVAFTKFLNAHPVIANQYGELKEQLAKNFTYDPEAYSKGKDQFVKKIELDALNWFVNQLN